VTGANFNCVCDERAFSIEEIERSHLALEDKHRRGFKTYNIRGVNKKLLLKISDFFKIIIPTLHTPMGLIDKFLESFLAWVHKEVVSFTEEEDEIREAMCWLKNT
jgi:hypothetical protein